MGIELRDHARFADARREDFLMGSMYVCNSSAIQCTTVQHTAFLDLSYRKSVRVWTM